MTGLTKATVIPGDNDEDFLIKTENGKKIGLNSLLSFEDGEKINIKISDEGISYIEKGTGEIEKLFSIYDKEGADTGTTYKKLFFKAVPTTRGTILAMREKVPGEYKVNYCLKIASSDANQNPLDAGGKTFYLDGEFTKEQMIKAAELFAKECDKNGTDDIHALQIAVLHIEAQIQES